MFINRRAALKVAATVGIGAVAARHPLVAAQPATDPALERRIRSVIEEYGDQGFHRTGTDVDRRSGDWLFDSVARLGLTAAREPFILSRVDPGDCRLVVGDRRIDGVPLFDGSFTGSDAVSGRLGPIGSDNEIGVVAAPPNTAAAGALGDARRQDRHQAIVCVTRGARAGLCLNNADSFLKPFGPPVLQVSSDERSFLEQHAATGTGVQLFAPATRTRAESFNVIATLAGSAAGLEPLIIMTPRSGWYACASERGGGIACWLEVMRAFRQTRPRRDVLFVASSGHELGHLGIDAFIEKRPGVVQQAAGWMHFGANIGAATRPPGVASQASTDPQRRHAVAALGSGITIQASDDEREALISTALTAGGLAIGRRVPRGTVPGGEAENVHRGGGRYVSVIGSNGLFHHPGDRGVHTVDLSAIASFVSAFTTVARTWAAAALILLASTAASAQPATGKEPPSSLRIPTRAELLRGEYGRYRANNDLLHYDLDVRIDPDRKWISGRNTVRFKMLKDDTRIQLELFANLNVDRIVLNTRELNYTRDLNTVYIDFPEPLRSGRTYSIDFHYSGAPAEVGRFDALAFKKDPAGGHWINTANEGVGSSVWWPGKDQWRDEPDGMDIKVSIPNGLTNVSNGRFITKTDLGDGYTKWHYRVHYPINSYNVSLNIANYVHFGETMGDLTLDYYVLPANLEKAKQQFAQVKPMMAAFLKYFGEYPFKKDGFKLIEVPYSGMEHQSAVTYGNRYANGYLERDWTGVGVSLKFDFIIIHESAHEWFGNAVSAAEQSDMWIQEGWATYLECLYVEHVFGYDDALKYTNGYKTKVGNKEPIIVQRGIARSPNQDQYFKGALFLHTLRNVVNDLSRRSGDDAKAGDAKWFTLIRDLYDEFKYKNSMTEEIVAFVNTQLGQDLTPIFDQYLRRSALPVLELTFDEKEQLAWYRWNAAERGFAMPIRVGDSAKWQTVQPVTSAWKSMPWAGTKDQFKIATDLYYVNVAVLDSRGHPQK